MTARSQCAMAFEMPNHVHGMIVVDEVCRGESRIRPSRPKPGDHKDLPYGTLPDTIARVIQAFKSP